MNDNEPLEVLIADARQAVLLMVMAVDVLAKRGAAEPSDFMNLVDFVRNVEAALETLIVAVAPRN